PVVLPPPPLPPTGPVLVPTPNEVLSTTPGGAALTPVFTAPAGQVIAAVGVNPTEGELAVAFQDGTVELLHLNPVTGTFDSPVSLVALDGAPPDPSALTVLDTASGPEVLVTSAGSDQLFVFGLEPTVPPTIPPEGEPGQPGQPTET